MQKLDCSCCSREAGYLVSRLISGILSLLQAVPVKATTFCTCNGHVLITVCKYQAPPSYLIYFKVRWHTCLTSDAIREGHTHVGSLDQCTNRCFWWLTVRLFTFGAPCDVTDADSQSNDVTPVRALVRAPTSRPWRHRLVDEADWQQKRWIPSRIFSDTNWTWTSPCTALPCQYKDRIMIRSIEGVLVEWSEEQKSSCGHEMSHES